MSEDRLISAKSLIIGFRYIAMEHATEASNSEHILGRVLHEHDYKIYNMIADHLETKGLGRTIDAVEVVHGRWESDMYFGEPVMRCTACKRGFAAGHKAERFPYCPNCGAKMDGGAEG